MIDLKVRQRLQIFSDLPNDKLRFRQGCKAVFDGYRISLFGSNGEFFTKRVSGKIAGCFGVIAGISFKELFFPALSARLPSFGYWHEW